MQHGERPNIISHGLLLAGLYFLSHWLSPYRYDPDALIFVWMIWSVTGVSTLSFIFKLMRF